jgi:zinc D-Ala-D-Ala carboxypeptidase
MLYRSSQSGSPMKKQVVFFPTVFGLIVCGFVLNFIFGETSVYAQMSRVSRIVKTEPATSSVESAAILAKFSAAASQNATLRSSLNWSFGKLQTGWDIYVPLILHTIGTDASPDSAQFASALSRWQARNSLQPNGVLDADTLGAFIKFWQSQRNHLNSAASEFNLVTAPISDFYDPTRSPDLLDLDRDAYAAYKRMVKAAARDLRGSLKVTPTGELAPDEKFLRIVSAYRSPEYQEELRRREPGSGRVALAKNSVHFTGRAIDLYVGGEPTITKDPNRMIQIQTPAYKWLVKNAQRFGFYPYFYEPWHWEYVPNK